MYRTRSQHPKHWVASEDKLYRWVTQCLPLEPRAHPSLLACATLSEQEKQWIHQAVALYYAQHGTEAAKTTARTLDQAAEEEEKVWRVLHAVLLASPMRPPPPPPPSPPPPLPPKAPCLGVFEETEFGFTFHPSCSPRTDEEEGEPCIIYIDDDEN
jgi:hypothetical protein